MNIDPALRHAHHYLDVHGPLNLVLLGLMVTAVIAAAVGLLRAGRSQPDRDPRPDPRGAVPVLPAQRAATRRFDRI